MNQATEKHLYDVTDYAEIAGIPEQSVTRMIRKNEIKAQKVGRKYKIPKSEIEKLLMLNNKDSSLSHFSATRELEIENMALRSQLDLLKSILSSATSIFGNDL